MKDIIIYTDGACKKNPGPGGYAAIILYGKESTHLEEDSDTKIVKKIQGGMKKTTNSVMELKAAYMALKYIYSIITKKENKDLIKNNGLDIYMYIDSNYVLKGLKEWHYKWEQKDYVNVKNSDLWQKTIAIYNSILEHNIEIIFRKVKGHSGQKYNDMVDNMASDMAKKMRK